jgi:flagellar biosynthesis protein
MARPKADASLKSAVALAYSETDAAPRVVAKGRGLVAEQIIARAHEHGVYVHESPELVALLLQIDLDQRIPPQLYVAVAELLAWLYRLESGGANSVNLIRSGPPAFVAPAEEALKP